MTGPGRRYRRWLVFLAALALPLFFASAAQAISLIKVREVYPGANNDSYVELQAFSGFIFSGDTLIGKSLVLFDDQGTPTLRFTFNEKNDLGADDTSFLIGDTGVESTFGVKPDIVDPLMKIEPSGGAACWNVGDIPVDCVAWGDFSGQAALTKYAETSVGNPASPGGITPGKAIERSIAANCPTWLESDDDTDDSAADFTEVVPNPEPAGYYDPAETPCFSGPSGTAITEKPANPSNNPSPHFEYSAPAATSYQCKLDSAPRFTTCPNGGIDYPNLSEGSHTLLVRGLNSNGPDVIPAAYTWTVDVTPPVTSFVGHPGATSLGTKASFSFSSGEKGTTFSCSLDSGPPAACQQNLTLDSLTGGTHTFRVAAVDTAGNVQSPPTSYTWTVDAAPPVTNIDSAPTNPTATSSVAFTYHSSRPDSVFECSMDGAPFSSCPSGGASYAGLATGSHTFAVRAIDSDGEVEATPAAYSFAISSATRPPPLACRKGFRKKTVHGTVRCVKVKARHHKRRQR
jgi:hypothetical protein